MTVTNALLRQIDAKLADGKRVMLGVAGAPTSGKSTLAEKLHLHYGAQSVILPMDGFHLDNVVLNELGILHRKGAPESFDVHGFLNQIKRVSKGEHIFAPKFDRTLDLSRAGAVAIRDQKIIIVEGNYLLLKTEPWATLANFWTLSVWVDLSLETIRERAIERWLEQGMSLEMATKRAVENDLKNARFTIENSDKENSIIV